VQLMALGDGVVVAVAYGRRDRPAVLEVRAIALKGRNNGCVNAAIDPIQQWRRWCYWSGASATSPPTSSQLMAPDFERLARRPWVCRRKHAGALICRLKKTAAPGSLFSCP